VEETGQQGNDIRSNKLANQAAFPQQLPGPAQPADDGFDPQQAVSPGPGSPELCFPEREEWAESIFFIFLLLHDLHPMLSSEDDTRNSLISPQSRHK